MLPVTRENRSEFHIASMKTTSMEIVSTGVLDKNKEHYLRSKDKAEKAYDVSRHVRLHMLKCKTK